MADSLVCSGATMKCTMGTSQAKLTVLPTRTVFLTGKPQANISDHLSMVNLAPFGNCRSMGFPATASATAAAQGTLTPMPCMHNTPFPWMGGKNDYIIKGDPALLKSSTCQCMWGGTISLVTDGQTDTGPADLSKKSKDKLKRNQANIEDNNKCPVINEQLGEEVQNTQNAPKENFESEKLPIPKKYSLEEIAMLLMISSQYSLSEFEVSIAKSTNRAAKKITDAVHILSNGVTTLLQNAWIDAKSQIETDFGAVKELTKSLTKSASNVVGKLAQSVIIDLKPLPEEIWKALTDDSLFKDMADGINRNAAQIIVSDFHQNATTDAEAKVMMIIGLQHSLDKKKLSGYEEFVGNNYSLLYKLGNIVNSLVPIFRNPGTPLPVDLLPEIFKYVISHTKEEEEALLADINELFAMVGIVVGKLDPVVNVLSSKTRTPGTPWQTDYLPEIIKLYYNISNRADVKAMRKKFRNSVIETGKDYFKSVGDAVSTLIKNMSTCINDINKK